MAREERERAAAWESRSLGERSGEQPGTHSFPVVYNDRSKDW